MNRLIHELRLVFDRRYADQHFNSVMAARQRGVEKWAAGKIPFTG